LLGGVFWEKRKDKILTRLKSHPKPFFEKEGLFLIKNIPLLFMANLV
jgi:hypothetical protein